MKQICLFFLVLLAAVWAQNDPMCGTKGPPPPGNLGIRNGTDARPNEFPWMAMSYFLNPVSGLAIMCGASILNNQWVLTAAHCVWDESTNQTFPRTNFYFFGGKYHMREPDSTIVVRSVNKIIVHESYNYSIIPMDNDIALLKLNETLDLNLKQLGSICLPEKQDPDLIADHHCIATGWGSINTFANSTEPKVLQKLTSNVWEQKLCKLFGPFMNDHHLCWGETYEGACAGDSGGPLNCYIDGKWYEYGVASAVKSLNGGDACQYTFFARTSEYSKWIWEKIREN